MITLEDFSIGFGHRRLLDNVSTTFADGKLTALIGRNGTGKSTLLRAIAGLNRGYTGAVRLDGSDIRSLRADRTAKMIAFVTTERIRIAAMRCEDVVAIGRAPYTNWIGRMQQEDKEAVYEALHAVGMQDYALRTMDTMSDGECQRIMIARALAQNTPNILLDEPTSFLDLPGRFRLARLLHTLAHEHRKCILFSTHELDVASKICDDIALIEPTSLIHLPVRQMTESGHIDRLFSLAE